MIIVLIVIIIILIIIIIINIAIDKNKHKYILEAQRVGKRSSRSDEQTYKTNAEWQAFSTVAVPLSKSDQYHDGTKSCACEFACPSST